MQNNRRAPDKIEKDFQRAYEFHQNGNLSKAEYIYRKIIQNAPTHFEALNFLGIVLFSTSRRIEALDFLSRSVKLNPNFAAAQCNLGIVQKEIGRYEESIESFNAAIKCNYNFFLAHFNKGDALNKMGKHQEALECYEITLKINPNATDAHYSRMVTLYNIRKFDKVIALCISVEPLFSQSSDFYQLFGLAFHALKEMGSAIEAFSKALALNPNNVNAFCNRANVYKDLENYSLALQDLTRALEISPEYPLALFNIGNIQISLGLNKDAVSSLEKLVNISPDYPFAKGHLLRAKMIICDWKGLNDLHQSISTDIKSGIKSAEPFGFQAISRSPSDLHLCARIYASEKFPSAQKYDLKLMPNQPGKKIRIGYLSGEFRNQATSILLIGVLENHDHEKFEIFAFDNGWDDESEIRKRITNSVDKLFDISEINDEAAAKIVYDQDIDILINLNGYFGNQRNGIFSHRACEIQINYLGFPGTLGMTYIDYIIADHVVIPTLEEKFYDEKVIFLPNSYQPTDNCRKISDRTFNRSDASLPNSDFIFCCFNNNYKITPDTFDLWMKILEAVPNSVLWLLEDNPYATENLGNEAEKRGISRNRLIAAPRVSHQDHLARHRLADLFLDTLPYNAHTTASDALWAGLPVLTRIGSTFPGRVAASLLYALDLPELITSDDEIFINTAISLAKDPERLATIRSRLDQNKKTSMLFDTVSYTRHLEAAFSEIYTRHRNGEPPSRLDASKNLANSRGF